MAVETGPKTERSNTEKQPRSYAPKYSRRRRKNETSFDSRGRRSSSAKSRITGTDRQLMAGTAIFFDVFAGILGLIDFIIPLVGTILSATVTALGFLTIWLWFAMKGVSLFNSQKKAWALIISATLETIPYINIIPAITLFTLRTIAIIKLEDIEKQKGR